jgi:hypothetical protein
MLDSAQFAPAMNCHLLVSDLLWPAIAGAASCAELELPALETLMARSQRDLIGGGSIERWLAARFGADGAGELALAPFALRGEGCEPGTHGWLRADPVHLRIHADHMVLADASRFALAADEAQELVDTLNAHFAPNNVTFFAPRPERWYARVAKLPLIRTTPTVEVAGRDIESYLPQGEEQAHWRSVFNEAQMLLHEHPCNERRERRGELTVNSLWFWGAGTESQLRASVRYDTVWSDNPVARGLAFANSIPIQPLPRSGSDFIESTGNVALPPDSLHLLILPPPPGAAYGDADAWREAVIRIERDWLAPLLDATLDGTLSAITLHALGPARGLRATFTRAHRVRVWRRRKRLSDYCA